MTRYLIIILCVCIFSAQLSLPVITNAAFPPVKFVSVRSPVLRGGTGLVVIQTTPGTPCTITVIYSSGPSHAQGLDPKTADTRGRITWSWKIGTRTTRGAWPIVVECGRDEITRIRTSFEVT